MKVLIIGANGFLGRHIAKLCIMREWETHALVHVHDELIPKECIVVPHDGLLTVAPDYDIVFIAAGSFRDEEKELVETNIRLVSEVSERFHDSRIVFVSSTMVYGVQNGIITESSPISNPTPYGLSKLGGEMTLKSHQNASIARITALYGPGMDEALFIPSIIRNARENKRISILGDGSRKQNYLNVKDAAVFCMTIAMYEKPGIFMGTGERSYSNNEVAAIVVTEFPGTEIVHEGPETRPTYEFDNSHSREVLKWSPVISLQDGIREMIHI